MTRSESSPESSHASSLLTLRARITRACASPGIRVRRCRSGWTLVETTVGMLVGTIALIALAGVLIMTSFLHSLSLSRLELVTVAEAKLDQLRAHASLQTTDTLRLAPGGSLTSDVANHHEQVTSARGRRYSVRWLVVAGLAGTRDVTVRVAPAVPRRNELTRMDANSLMLVR